jgi:hypothetical protein
LRLLGEVSQDGGDLGGRILAVRAGQPALRDRVVPGPLLRSRGLQHQHGHQRAELRRTLQAEGRAAPGEETGPERVADAGGVGLTGLGHHVDAGGRAVGLDDVDTLGAERRHPQADLFLHIGLRPAGLGEQQLPLVVIGEQVGRTVDELVDVFPGQAGQLLGGVGGKRQAELAALLGVHHHRVGVVGPDDDQVRLADRGHHVSQLDSAGLRHRARVERGDLGHVQVRGADEAGGVRGL